MKRFAETIRSCRKLMSDVERKLPLLKPIIGCWPEMNAHLSIFRESWWD